MKLKSYAYSSLFFALLIPSLVYAVSDQKLIILNHYDKALNFTINVNSEVLPDLSKEFSLDVNGIMTSKVLDLKKPAYILTEDNQNNLGFWSVEVSNNQTLMHGYTSKGIAFTFNGQTIIFCTPKDYQNAGACY